MVKDRSLSTGPRCLQYVAVRLVKMISGEGEWGHPSGGRAAPSLQVGGSLCATPAKSVRGKQRCQAEGGGRIVETERGGQGRG